MLGAGRSVMGPTEQPLHGQQEPLEQGRERRQASKAQEGVQMCFLAEGEGWGEVG